jgi:hypothetical protein
MPEQDRVTRSPVTRSRRRRHPARRTRRGLAVGATVATFVLTGALWAGDALGSTAATTSSHSSARSSTSTGSFESDEDDTTGSSSTRSTPSFTPSSSRADTSSHAS